MAEESPLTMVHFTVGELVWRRVKGWAAGSKLAPKALGPFRVLRVAGTLGQQVQVLALPQVGHKRTRQPLWVHAAQLAPYLGDYEPPELVYQQEEPEYDPQEAASPADVAPADVAPPPKRGRGRPRRVPARYRDQ